MRTKRVVAWLAGGLAAVALVAVLGAGLSTWHGASAVEHAAAPQAAPASPTGAEHAVLRGRPVVTLERPGAVAAGETAAGAQPTPAPAPRGDERDTAAAGDDDHVRDGLPLTADHPLVAPVIAIQNRYTRDLMRHPGVVGTATGMTEDGEIAIVVLAKEEITDLPSRIEGVPVIVHVSGELFASKGPGSGHSGGGGGGTTVDRTARFDRPVPIGVSTGHPDITAGTIGCRVTDGTFFFALSNNHVYAHENLATPGDDVLQPGAYDGGSAPDDVIGTLADYVTIDFHTVQQGGANTVDAAIAMCDTGDLGAATPADGYGLPHSTTVSPAINLRVMKYGRTTGQTNGKIYAINASVNVGYSSGTAGYVNQIVIIQGGFSAGGDSGSLIVGQKGADARKPVALLFAGSSSTTIGCPIDAVLDSFSVAVDGD